MDIKFDKEDFEVISYQCIFINETSGTECRDFASIEILEYFDDGINLIVPSNSCSQGHILLVIFFRDLHPNLPKNIPANGKINGSPFNAIGRIVSKKSLDNDDRKNMCEVEIKFTQFDTKLWMEMLNFYREKQTKINNLFKNKNTK